MPFIRLGTHTHRHNHTQHLCLPSFLVRCWLESVLFPVGASIVTHCEGLNTRCLSFLLLVSYSVALSLVHLPPTPPLLPSSPCHACCLQLSQLCVPSASSLHPSCHHSLPPIFAASPQARFQQELFILYDLIDKGSIQG